MAKPWRITTIRGCATRRFSSSCAAIILRVRRCTSSRHWTNCISVAWPPRPVLLALIEPQSQVLDIGAGLGGLMRQGAAMGLHMTGLDITHRFSALNRAISQLMPTPMGGKLRWVTGNASALPFTDASFDAVVFQHSLMNMPDPESVLAQCRRVLRPGGQLVMHEVVGGSNQAALRFPVPWAEGPEHSHLLSLEALTTLLQRQGFTLQHHED